MSTPPVDSFPKAKPRISSRSHAKKAVNKNDRTKGGAIQDFLNLEDLLHKIVREANEILAGDGCSIFLWHDELGRFVLRESTVMAPFIGKYSLEPAEDVVGPHCGITTKVAVTGEPHLSAEVRKDRYWHWYRRIENDFPQTDSPDPCEIPRQQLLSVIAVPLKDEENCVKGILRVVRKRPGKPFTQTDLMRLEELANTSSLDILGALSLGKLIEIGSILDEKELCQKAVELLANMVRGKGCSIFLLDDAESTDGQSVYNCKASTGLEERNSDGKYVPVKDTSETSYKIPMDYELGRLTAYVIQKKRNVVVPNLYKCDFKKEFQIPRPEGVGKYSEAFYRKGGQRAGTGSFMATPLFFRERFDPKTPAMGVIRLTRPKGDPPFQAHEQRRFFMFAERLSRTILQCRYIALLNSLATATKEEDQFSRVASTIPKLLGGKGCSVFVGNPHLAMKATSGSLKEKFKAGKIEPYIINDKGKRGYTVAAAQSQKPVCFNNENERKSLEKEGIVSSGRGECEVDEMPPSRFLAVPILADEVLGVIRLPKTRAEAPFSSNDVDMLQSVANHLGRIIETENLKRMGKHLDPQIYDLILTDPSLLSIKSRKVTICFWDIRGFSKLCDNLREHPPLIAEFIKAYSSLAAQTISKHKGVLDKFIGDGVMALFGVPNEKLDNTTAAIVAVEAALDLRERFNNLAAEWKEKWGWEEARKIEIGLGCGIHTGDVLVGIFETGERHQYTALGPSVNLASRIEKIAKPGQILVTQTTRLRVESKFAIGRDEDHKEITVKNIGGVFELYSVDGPNMPFENDPQI